MPYTTPGTATAGDVLTASFWNTNVRDNTAALYSTIQRIAYTQRTSNYSATSTTVAGAADVFTGGGATGAALTWTADGTSAYRIEFFCCFGQTATNAGAELIINLVDGSGTDLARIAYVGRGNGTYAGSNVVHSIWYYTPSAGSKTINIRAINSVATATLNAGAGGAAVYIPMWLAIFGPPMT